MALKEFCKNCKHKDVDIGVKRVFNEMVQRTFVVCPIEKTENISGCLIKDLTIDWNGFIKFCESNSEITENDNREED